LLKKGKGRAAEGTKEVPSSETKTLRTSTGRGRKSFKKTERDTQIAAIASRPYPARWGWGIEEVTQRN